MMKCIHGKDDPQQCYDCKNLPDRIWKGVRKLYRREAGSDDPSYIVSATMGLIIRQCVLHGQHREQVLGFVGEVYDATIKELRG